MLNQKSFAPLPALCMGVLIAAIVIGLSCSQGSARAAGISKIQGLEVVPGQNSPCSGGDNCYPNFRYWGHWPTVWRRWPQRRPDILFPEARGLEGLPVPEGAKPEPLPKEEPYISPIAPQPGGDFIPQVGEGPATGPDASGIPFQLQPGFDPGSGFDQGVPGMENLPALPAEGTDNQGGGAPALTTPPADAPPAAVPPATNTAPPAAEPALDKGSADSLPDSSVLTLRTRSAKIPQVPATEEQPVARLTNPVVPGPEQPGETRMPETQPEQTQPPEPQEPGPQLVKTEPEAQFETQPSVEDLFTVEPAVSEAAVERLPKCEAAVGESFVDETRPVPEPVQQTAYESFAEPWAAQKSFDPAALTTNHGKKQPTIGLEGYCPVDLVRDENWTVGDARFAVEFQGHKYLMCGPEQHRAFRSNPARYAPANAGNDPVLSFEEDLQKTGRTESCAVFEGRLYMFENADTMARFRANPTRYTRALQKVVK